MKLGQYVADFLSDPFDPNGDGKTSAMELALVIGLVAILTIAWNRALHLILQA